MQSYWSADTKDHGGRYVMYGELYCPQYII